MKILITGALLFTSLAVNLLAQTTNNIVVFVEEPKPFYAVVNGIKQNSQPKTNVKITGLTNPSSSIRIVFEDGTPDLEKKTWFDSMGKEATYRIVNTKKGYKMRFFGEVDLASSVDNKEQSVIVYHTEPLIEVPVENEEVTVIEEVTTTTTSSPKTNSENVNVGIDVGGFGVSMNINVDDVNEDFDAEYSSTTTITTTTTTNVSDVNNSEVETEAPKPVIYVPGYKGKIGCPIPETSVVTIKSAIENESFSSDKMITAKQATKNRCITVNQVRNLISAFDFEDKKLEFAKYAYERTHDLDNYYLINNDFDFSSNKESLNKYVLSK